ncbi:ArnT family glycosyltransferase [Edaphobacter modestus]|uniref:Dolichyl-phosphate-mannose-protein mannosyltransferase n=1 Tax=Edaphobacter modestus TaxID=388466 RepID=A0A4Q7YTK4_9BACT|nr:glycosyltransferase family 39 protein [Edaphobacter modestus]RZU40614.1 dolichyl-phosphate-mannose-protein mannosyltransferase [Edaphobacter modestus]
MQSSQDSRRAPADLPTGLLFPLFFAAIYLSHLTLLRLPYFWDEAGYYIPAAWDFFRTGSLIPQTTLSNAHPPLPSILLASWWHVSGFVVSGTRTLVVMVAATALVAVFHLAKTLRNIPVAIATVVLTAVYPIWFAQSTLAHADIFAAAFTLWALALYFEPRSENQILTSGLFSFAALSKETAIVTPLALAGFEAFLLFRSRNPSQRRSHALWIASLLSPLLPLVAWYAYHRHRTGFIFGNPEFLRYNATANLDLLRILLSLWHRFLHLATHMNMYVPVVCAIATLFIPLKPSTTHALPRRTLAAILSILIANWIAFSVLGGALLTRYLLPMYPLVLLLCITVWQRHLRNWWLLAILTGAGFLAGIWINPPYAFAPEDNLTYRDMIVLHQQAASLIENRYPQATVLTAWPASAELTRPELGYVRKPLKVVSLQNFAIDQMARAAQDPGEYDTALLFSTKWEPPRNQLNLGKATTRLNSKYFDFHHDLSPSEAAALLHGEIVWQARRKGEWAAVLRFPRAVNASLTLP